MTPDDDALLTAYLDGELDEAEARALALRLET
ncbi:zf-HC2 domain-containing protein, partial [Mycobacterium tuberculosis]|nr:zf-HC2 domain-containing protein [Mycobacterium tuberculosis]